MRNSLFIATSMLSLVISQSDLARACSCLPPPDVLEAFDRADAVFLGEVLDVNVADPRNPFAMIRMDIAVIQSWKGVTSARVSVLTASNEAACGLTIGPGRHAVFYVRRDQITADQQDWTISLCSRTGLTNGAMEDADEFNRLGLEPLTLVEGSGSELPSPPWGALCGNGVTFAAIAAMLLTLALRFARLTTISPSVRLRRRSR